MIQMRLFPSTRRGLFLSAAATAKTLADSLGFSQRVGGVAAREQPARWSCYSSTMRTDGVTAYQSKSHTIAWFQKAQRLFGLI